MLTILILIILIILLISNSDIVITGASTGLLLWYKNVLPLLLPFMIISGIMEETVIKQYQLNKHNSSKLSVLATLCMGLFCGYPIGAKSNAYFVQHGLINKRLANILLPISNNVSPMFFIGFILESTLKDSISISLGYLTIFLPYIIFIITELLLYPKGEYTLHSLVPTDGSLSPTRPTTGRNIAENSIYQITFVGLYIMLCSIISEFISHISLMSDSLKYVLIGVTEITRGVIQISQTDIFHEQIKTALILACTSFGGISSILQTNKVIQGSGLSLLHYIAVKFLCAIGSFFLYLLIV